MSPEFTPPFGSPDRGCRRSGNEFGPSLPPPAELNNIVVKRTSLRSRRTVRPANKAVAMRDQSIRRIAPALLLVVLSVAVALAQPGTRRGEKYALLVGVRKYDANEL